MSDPKKETDVKLDSIILNGLELPPLSESEIEMARILRAADATDQALEPVEQVVVSTASGWVD